MTAGDKQIAIFVSAHKPTDIIENSIIKPIQVGVDATNAVRIKGFLSDSEGDNISKLNPKFCELTSIYWAWKNTDVDYYGFFHYRRYFSFSEKKMIETTYGTVELDGINENTEQLLGLSPENITNTVRKYDIILPELKNISTMPRSGNNNRELYSSSGYLHSHDLDIMLSVLKEKHPEFMPYAEEYLAGNKTYLNNMFIMRKDIFSDYCKWLFDILFECDKRINYSDYSTEAYRTPGHLAERLLNIYIRYLMDTKNYKIKELQTVYFLNTEPTVNLEPAFETNNIAIALSADDYYSPYIATVIKSILLNSTKRNNYDILIMNRDISKRNQEIIKSLINDNPNFSIRFINLAKYQDKFNNLFLRGHFTIETWFRLLMPEIMSNYDKVLYLDSDLVLNVDIAPLFKEEIDGYLLAACHDADTAGLYNGFDPNKKKYMDDVLKIENPYNYFQAGVILFNLKEFRNTIKTDELLKFASSYDWQLLDQDVLNYIAQDKVKYIDMSWNVMYDWLYRRRNEIISLAPKYLQDEYDRAHARPKIIHYAGPDKPWNDPNVDYAELFWKCCRQTPYYEELIKRMMDYSQKKEKKNIKKTIKSVAKTLLPENTKRGVSVRRMINKFRSKK